MKFSLLSRCWQLKLVGSVAIFGTISVAVSVSEALLQADRLNAQIVPDNTLGAERSVVTPNLNIRGIQSDRIDGGATRGANLFHSFGDFNIEAGRGVYFANPTGIENILTRVTGNNASNILGRLGVLGGANLFLLNPNGIIFGPNASLDLQGSFVATTANRIQLGDRGYFSATQPQRSSLLSVTPGALFFNAVANQPTSIINQGNLATPKNLTLSAGNLDLQGQLQVGGDLTLQAQDTVKVRDSVTTPFLAQTGKNLTIIGNQGIDILALNHPTQTPFISGGNLSLISEGVISGDARFSSGGSFSIQSLSGGLANFVSLYDPIISSNGDVDVAANYTGASLLVESKGNIRFGGDINITGPDTSGLPGGRDTATLSRNSALIMRSGQRFLAYGGVNSGSVPQDGNGGVPAGITLGGNVILQPFNGVGGIVDLTAASGDVSTQLISTNGQQTLFNYDNDATGGAISISAKDGSITTGDLYSYSSSYSDSGNAGDGGAISLSAANDIFITGFLDSSSYSNSGNAGDGGAISLSAANDIFITGFLYSYSSSDSGNAGNGGAISLSAANDINLTGDLYSDSFSRNGNAGNGGAITLSAVNDIFIKGNLDSSSRNGNAGNGGAISLSAANDIFITGFLDSSSSSGSGNAGNGGVISLSAGNDINLGDLDSYSSSRNGNAGNAGNGGAISLSAGNDINLTGNLDSSSRNGNAGNGGAISLSAANDIFITGFLYSYSYSNSGNAGDGGAISLSAANDIFITGFLDSSSSSGSGNAGNGGVISLSAANDIFITGFLYSYSYSNSGNAGDGGAISLSAANDIFITGSLYSYSYSLDGTAGQGGAISLIARGGDIVGIPFELSFYDDVKQQFVTAVRTPILGSFSISEQGTAGNGGKVTLEVKNNIGNLDILTLSSSSQSGAVQITGLGDLLLTNTNIVTSKQVTVPDPFISGQTITLDVSGIGQSGNVAITSSGNLTFNNSRIESDTKGSDPAGNVTIISPNLVTFNDSSIKSNTSNTGAAGRINIEAGQGIILFGSNSELSTIFAGTTDSGEAGDITLTAPQLSLQNGAKITSDTTSTSGAGAITLQSHPNTENLNINLTPRTSISASTSGQGTGGNIEIKAPNAITIQGQGTITTETTGTGTAGELRIDTKHLTIADGATISASTSSPNPEGRGGSIIINATESFNLNNQASLRAQSTGAAPGGNITISTGQLTVNNGSVATSSEQSSGGDINITASNVRLFDNSDITTTVNSGTGKGGDITLTAGSIVAFGDSDILAYAPTGTGGNINLKTPAFFGENYRPAPPGTDPRTLEGNNQVDVNATGVVSGVITIPDTSFIRNSLSELPNNQINTDQLLANSCIVRRNQPTKGSFFITGTGGLPERPGDLQMSSFPTVDIETLPSDFGGREQGSGEQGAGDNSITSAPCTSASSSEGTSSTTNENRPWQKGDPIVEPQGVYRLPNGKLVLSRECP